jgi:hypothetical protein
MDRTQFLTLNFLFIIDIICCPPIPNRHPVETILIRPNNGNKIAIIPPQALMDHTGQLLLPLGQCDHGVNNLSDPNWLL